MRVNILALFCCFFVKKLRKRLAVRKNRRTFAAANERGTPDSVGADVYARSSRGALRFAGTSFFEILTTRQVVQGSTVSTRRNRHF